MFRKKYIYEEGGRSMTPHVFREVTLLCPNNDKIIFAQKSSYLCDNLMEPQTHKTYFLDTIHEKLLELLKNKFLTKKNKNYYLVRNAGLSRFRNT